MIEFTYSHENERKRIEYLISRLKTNVRKMSTYTFVVDDQSYEMIKKELQEKFPEESVSIFKVEELGFQRKDISIDSIIETGKLESEVISFMNYLISKKRGVFEDQASSGSSNYRLYTRKGLIWIKFSTIGKENCKLQIVFDGPEDAVKSLKEEFMKEIEMFLGLR